HGGDGAAVGEETGGQAGAAQPGHRLLAAHQRRRGGHVGSQAARGDGGDGAPRAGGRTAGGGVEQVVALLGALAPGAVGRAGGRDARTRRQGDPVGSVPGKVLHGDLPTLAVAGGG